jgi:hypothetical protein
MQSRNYLRWFGYAFAISAWILAFIPQVHAQSSPRDLPGVHGMLIVGERAVYLSHLSMFPKSPHRFQAIFEVELPNQAAYTSDRASNPNQRIYTLEPAEFVLTNLIPTQQGPAPMTSIPVKTIQRGHFEKTEPNEKILVQSGNVKIKRVLHFREYQLGASPIPQLRYLLFGTGGDLFLAHFINGAPDFDHVLTVRTLSPSPSQADLKAGILVEIPNRRNTINDRLVDSLTVDGTTVVSRKPMKIATGRTLYFEEGELLIPPDFVTTAEEKTAGFP